MPEFTSFCRVVGLAPHVVKNQIPKHRDFLSEEFLIRSVLAARVDELDWIDEDHFTVSVRRKKDGEFVCVYILVHDQGWRCYVYGVHVEACRQQG